MGDSMQSSVRGRVIVPGDAQGEALVSRTPLGFLGGIDADSGTISEPGHPLFGQSISGRILVFPCGKGSTVGSYVLYRLARAGRAPAAIINTTAEPIVAVGALISDIPLVDHIDISCIETGMRVVIADGMVTYG